MEKIKHPEVAIFKVVKGRGNGHGHVGSLIEVPVSKLGIYKCFEHRKVEDGGITYRCCHLCPGMIHPPWRDDQDEICFGATGPDELVIERVR